MSAVYCSSSYISCRVTHISASYLEVPRIHFAGRFRADIPTGNNYLQNYLIAKFNGDDIYPSWNLHGTGEFWFTDCKVTSVVYENGHKETDQDKEPLIGKPIVNNPGMAPAKLVDLDSPERDLSSTVYGMRFGIDWSPTQQTDSFIAEWVRSSLSRDMWMRQINDTTADRYTQTIGTQGTSRLEEVIWGNDVTSEALRQLKKAYDSESDVTKRSLSVSVTLFNYTRAYQEDWFTYGLVVGTIGIGSIKEPLSFVGERVMNRAREKDPPLKDVDCKGNTEWLFTSYFTVHTIDQTTKVTIDFGNSVKLNFQGKVCDVGRLYLGILVEHHHGPKPVHIIGEIPYSDDSTSGVYDFTLPRHTHYTDHPFVVVRIEHSGNEVDNEHHYQQCTPKTSTADQGCADVILEETPLQVRPMDHHFVRLEAGQSTQIRMLVRHFGSPPSSSSGHQTYVKLINDSPDEANPTKGLEYNPTVPVDSEGIATFDFTAKEVGKPRAKSEMDGVIYMFSYCCSDSAHKEYCEDGYTNVLSFLVWGKTTYDEPVFWDVHVRPIFDQYEQLYPTMSNIVRLGDYNDVTKPGIIRLINKAMNLPFNHPSYMPVTRDLSPSRKDMILKWVNSEELYRNWSHVEEVHYTAPEFCKDSVHIDENFRDKKMKFARTLDEIGKEIFEESLVGDDKTTRKFMSISAPNRLNLLPSWTQKDFKGEDVCNLAEDLQSALSLEFATIPLYLTSMYSIKPGQNTEVYGVIHSVVMQEMLHLAQVANMLISLGERPIIDDENAVPSYPTKLPAGVLPGLTVTLQKASPKHIYDVLMMVEFPHDEADTENDMYDQLTIGQFYSHIKKCIRKQDHPFCKDMTTEECTRRQIQWPWPIFDPTSQLLNITNKKSAFEAIKMIKQQGEGAGHQNPTYLDSDKLAHFYKFEELACKQHLKAKDEHEYGFFGKEIEFIPEGVWPMRDNPSSLGIPKGSQTYHRARTFHRIYRALLTKLQEMFDGSPTAIDDTVYLMESLQLHTKELMQLEVPSKPGWPKQTCGPIFQYNWKDETDI